MNLKTVKLLDLKPDPKNTKKHDKRNIETIKESLKKFGQYRPFVVQKKGMIIRVGNGMYQAMQELGWAEGQAEIKELTDQEATTLSILDNHSSELATWDEQILSECLNGLPEDLFDLTGFEHKIEQDLINTQAQLENIELKSFNKTHVLISFNPEKLIEIQNLLESIKKIPGVEYEQSSN